MIPDKLPHNNHNDTKQCQIFIRQPHMLQTLQTDHFQKLIEQPKLRVIHKRPGQPHSHPADNTRQKKHRLKKMAPLNLLKQNISKQQRQRQMRDQRPNHHQNIIPQSPGKSRVPKQVYIILKPHKPAGTHQIRLQETNIHIIPNRHQHKNRINQKSRQHKNRNTPLIP